MSILEAFGETRDQLTLAAIAEETGLYKSTILRLAGSLQRFGYLVRESDGSFRLGPSLWRLGSLYRRGFDLGEVVRPALRRLVAATGETASFYVREGDERLCLYRENSPQAARHHLDEGVRLALDRGASAHVLRSFDADADPQTRGRVITSVGERNPDVAALAAPVVSPRGVLHGALSISGLVGRFDEAKRRDAEGVLMEVARDLSARIG